MIRTLPADAAPHMATVFLVGELTSRQRQAMQWIMEDPLVRDRFEASLAEFPATRGSTTHF
ncbi:hypothetical protein UP06_30375 [Bradyrhizobium sp. LTSP857]|nr:hypothetical protein UP06_30375 [Bradyrhizobium sp. LTSP857]